MSRAGAFVLPLLLACAPAPPREAESPASLSPAAPATSVSDVPTPASSGPPAAAVNDEPQVSAPKLRLGHYSSGDGLIGFVLDRTATPARLKMDGEQEGVVLEVRDQDDRGTDYVAPKRLFLRATMAGQVMIVLHQTKNSVAMFRDADAIPLSGGPSPPMATSEERQRLVPRLRLGHYSSGDGSIGLVLDRTGPRPRFRLDGEREVRTLEPMGPSGENVDVRLVGLDKPAVVMRFGVRGEVFYFKKGSTFPLKRDGDAQPLP